MNELKQIKYNRTIFNYLLSLKKVQYYGEDSIYDRYVDKEMDIDILTVDYKGCVVGHRIDKMCEKLNIVYSDNNLINIRKQITIILKISFL